MPFADSAHLSIDYGNKFTNYIDFSIMPTNLMIVRIPLMIGRMLMLIQPIPLAYHLQIFASQIP
jgi:hypothetical protein